MTDIAQADIVALDPAQVRVLPDNPNAMAEAEFRSLVDSMKDAGHCVQTILVAARPDDPDKPFTLVDGEHRLRACRALGYQVPAVVEEWEDDAIIAWRIGMNKRRGSLNHTMAASQIRGLLEASSAMDAGLVSTLTGFPADELQLLLQATSNNTDLLGGVDARPPEEDDKPKTYAINIVFASEATRDRCKAALLDAAEGGTLADGLQALALED